MNTQWQQFLVTQGATIEDDRVVHFASDVQTETQAALSGSILCDLSHYGLIRVSGPEAESFLQNQFCNDVRNVTESQSQLNGYCNPKGRALAFFRLFRRGEHYYLRLPQSILQPTLNRLRMFVLMTKVTLEDASDELVRIGFSAPDAEQQLQMVLGNIPVKPDDVHHAGDISVIRVTDTRPRFELYGPVEAIQALWETLAKQATPVGHGGWELLDIQAGIPEVYEDTQEAFVPQMINLQAISALSFKKGCYPGQEIVARMHYLGKLKRRMYLAHVDSDEVPAAGEALFAEGSESAQGVGKVVRAQRNPGGGTELLAVIEIASADQRPLRLKNADGPLLKLEELPYIVGEEE
jgi:folate-binding protein YgfZ